MAVYRDKNKNRWIIKCINPTTKRSTTIRRNPKTNYYFLTKREAKEFELYYLKSRIDITQTFDSLFKKYVDDYLSLRPSSSADKLKSWYKSNIKNSIGKKKAISITLSDLEHLARDMLIKGYSINYINKMTSNIKTVLNFGVSHGFIERNPVTAYKPLKKVKTTDEIKYLTPREFNRLIESIPEFYTKHTNSQYIRYLLMFAYLTGARKGEIRALRWSQIDLQKRRIHFDYHINEKNELICGRKNGNGYLFHMDDLTFNLVKEIYEFFSTIPEFNQNAFVFPSLEKGFFEPIGGHTPTRWMNQLTEYNGFTRLNFHSLRHSAVCYWSTEVGLTPYEVADRIGDTVGVVLQHYYQFFQESRIKVAEKISQNQSVYLSSILATDDRRENQ